MAFRIPNLEGFESCKIRRDLNTLGSGLERFESHKIRIGSIRILPDPGSAISTLRTAPQHIFPILKKYSD